MKIMKNNNGSRLHVDASNFQGTHDELRRAQYVLAFLQTSSKTCSQKESGLSLKAHTRIIQMLARQGSLSSGPKSGRPLSYTENEMEAAYDLLCNQTEVLLTGVSLLKQLIEDGLLHTDASPQRFLEHLKAFIMRKGHRLITNSTRTTFFLAKGDIKLRLSFAGDMLKDLEKRKLTSLVFEDEVLLEEGPHPKGENYIVGAQQSFSNHFALGGGEGGGELLQTQ